MENNESNYCTLTRFKSSSQRHDQEMPRGANHSDNETEAANASPFVSTYCTAKRPRRPQAGQTEVTMGSQISHESVKLDENATILREKLIEQVELGKRMAESDLEDEDNEYKLLENVGLEESSFEDSLDQATYVISDGIDSSPIESFQDSLDFRAKESTRNVPKSSLENLEDLDNDQPIQANIDLFNDLLDHQEPVHQSSTQYCTLRKLSTSPSTATEADNKTIGKYCTIKLNNKQLDALHVTEHDNIYENKTLEFYLHDLDNYLNKIEGEEVCGADNSLSGVACDTLGEGELNVKG